MIFLDETNLVAIGGVAVHLYFDMANRTPTAMFSPNVVDSVAILCKLSSHRITVMPVMKRGLTNVTFVRAREVSLNSRFTSWYTACVAANAADMLIAAGRIAHPQTR